MQEQKPMLIQPWQPLKWKPVYEQMVALHMAGYSNVEIGGLLDYHPVQVGNILKSDLAKGVIANLSAKIRTKTAETLPEQIEKLRTLSFQRVQECLEDKDLAEKNRHAMANTAMSFLKGIGSLTDGNSVVKHQLSLAPEFAAGIAAALSESNQVKELHSGKEEEADYEFIEGSNSEASKSS